MNEQDESDMPTESNDDPPAIPCPHCGAASRAVEVVIATVRSIGYYCNSCGRTWSERR